jgi:hypothetical protein
MNEATRHARRVQLVELLNELEEAAGAYEHGSTDDESAITEAKFKIIALFEALTPPES